MAAVRTVEVVAAAATATTEAAGPTPPAAEVRGGGQDTARTLQIVVVTPITGTVTKVGTVYPHSLAHGRTNASEDLKKKMRIEV